MKITHVAVGITTSLFRAQQSLLTAAAAAAATIVAQKHNNNTREIYIKHYTRTVCAKLTKLVTHCKCRVPFLYNISTQRDRIL